MSCKSPCPKYYDLGCFSHCSDIELDFQVPIAGTYMLEYEIGGLIKMHEYKEMVAGEKLKFNTSCLNECSNVIMQVFDSEGNLITCLLYTSPSPRDS